MAFPSFLYSVHSDFLSPWWNSMGTSLLNYVLKQPDGKQTRLSVCSNAKILRWNSPVDSVSITYLLSVQQTLIRCEVTWHTWGQQGPLLWRCWESSSQRKGGNCEVGWFHRNCGRQFILLWDLFMVGSFLAFPTANPTTDKVFRPWTSVDANTSLKMEK